MQVTCHPRLGGASRRGGGGHRNAGRPDFRVLELLGVEADDVQDHS